VALEIAPPFLFCHPGSRKRHRDPRKPQHARIPAHHRFAMLAGMTMFESAMLQYYVYIMARAYNSTLYVGMTNDLIRRVYEHREGLVEGFSKTYGTKTLVYFEIHTDVTEAIRREKSIKRWSRAKKYTAIMQQNPKWKDLYETLF
jgi:putative endonuclease